MQRKKERVLLALSSMVQCIIVDKSWQLVALYPQSAMRGMNTELTFSLLLSMPAHAIVLPTFRLGLFPLVNLTQKLPHRHAQRYISQAIRYLVNNGRHECSGVGHAFCPSSTHQSVVPLLGTTAFKFCAASDGKQL